MPHKSNDSNKDTVRAEPVEAPVACREALRQAQGERYLSGLTATFSKVSYQ